MKTKFKVTAVSGFRTSMLYGREEYEDDVIFFHVESITRGATLAEVIREFPGAKLIRNYLKMHCRTDLKGQFCLSRLADPYYDEDEDIHVVYDVANILNRVEAEFELEEGPPMGGRTNVVPVAQTVLLDNIYENSRREYVFTIHH